MQQKKFNVPVLLVGDEIDRARGYAGDQTLDEYLEFVMVNALMQEGVYSNAPEAEATESYEDISHGS